MVLLQSANRRLGYGRTKSATQTCISLAVLSPAKGAHKDRIVCPNLKPVPGIRSVLKDTLEMKPLAGLL